MYFVLFLGNNLKKHLIINCVLAALSYHICTVVLMLPYYILYYHMFTIFYVFTLCKVFSTSVLNESAHESSVSCRKYTYLLCF